MQAPTSFQGPDVVEDMQLPPALCITADTTIAKALELGTMREYDMLPILDANKRPLGYLDLRKLRDLSEKETEAPVPTKMTEFRRAAKYQVITPETPLMELELFFRKNTFCFVTDRDRRWVLAVATPEDLEKYLKRRGGGSSPGSAPPHGQGP